MLIIIYNYILPDITTEQVSRLKDVFTCAFQPFAGEHHERLDGSGYHQGLCEKELPLQSRIIAFADIFEALTANDRPYRKPMQLSQVINILGFMKKDRHIDPDIHDFFMTENLHLTYAEKSNAPASPDSGQESREPCFA